MMKTPYGNRDERLRRENKITLRPRGGRSKFAWVFGATAAVSALLYWEQTGLLYVLSILAVCGLLLVVAFSDLEGRDKELNKTDLENDVASALSGMTPNAFSPASAGASQANEQTMKRRKAS